MSDSTSAPPNAALPYANVSTVGRLPFVDASISRMEIDVESESPTPAIRLLLNFICAIAMGGLAILTWDSGHWPLSIFCWLVGGHFMHTFALSFHDAAHGTLYPDKRINELLGSLYGTMILVPLTVYRRAHAHHHANLASIDDPELYPFVIPGTSRSIRLVCVVAEILLGYVYTPLLFARFVLVDKMPPSVRRRIVAEYAVIILMVVLVLMAVAITESWKLYLLGLLAPASVGGAYQTLRKYTEHLGLCGTSILESTRSVLPRDPLNYTISSLVQHVDHHGTHHIRARIPYFELPRASEQIYNARQDGLPVYRSYAAAFFAMLLTLSDPKAGAQWQTDERPFVASK